LSWFVGVRWLAGWLGSFACNSHDDNPWKKRKSSGVDAEEGCTVRGAAPVKDDRLLLFSNTTNKKIILCYNNVVRLFLLEYNTYFDYMRNGSLKEEGEILFYKNMTCVLISDTSRCIINTKKTL
jgi:hypothetical protein